MCVSVCLCVCTLGFTGTQGDIGGAAASSFRGLSESVFLGKKNDSVVSC